MADPAPAQTTGGGRGRGQGRGRGRGRGRARGRGGTRGRGERVQRSVGGRLRTDPRRNRRLFSPSVFLFSSDEESNNDVNALPDSEDTQPNPEDALPNQEDDLPDPEDELPDPEVHLVVEDVNMPGPSGLQSVAADAEYYADLNHAVDASLLVEDRNSQDETDRRFQYDSPTGRLTNMEIAVTETLRWMRTNPVGKFLQINFHLVLLNMREQYPGVYDGTDRHVFHTISRWVHGAADRRHLGRNALCVPRSRIGHVAQEEHTIINHLTDKLISLLNENSSTIHRNYLGGS